MIIKKLNLFLLFLIMSFEIIREIELAFIDVKTNNWDEAKEQIIANINKAQIIKDRYLCRKDLKIEIENCIYHLLPQFFKQNNYNFYETINDFTFIITKKEIIKLIYIITKLIIKKNDF